MTTVKRMSIPPTIGPSRWKFAGKLPNNPQNEPISDEFFAGLSDPSDKLIRESIQNSLDACAKTGPVRVRFTIPADSGPIAADSPWLCGLVPHLTAKRNGLREPGIPEERLSILLIEDYGTCGLTGDPAQTDNAADEWNGRKNDFFYFWRAIGATGKGEGEKGSWGLGKAVLPASSRIHTFFGVSCEEPGSDARVLGLSVLKTHAVAGQTFTPYGYFGQYASPDSVAMPMTEEAAVSAFCQDFGVTRLGLPGLSLVVLFPSLQLSGPSLIASAVVNYFFPILERQLVVEVAEGDKITVIDAASIGDHSLRIPPQLLEEHGIESTTLHDLLALARWSIEQRRTAAVRLNPPVRLSSWDEKIFAVEGWSAAVARFAAGGEVEFVVPVSVTPKEGSVQNAEFFVSMKKAPSERRAKSFYLRDGITIGKIPEPVARGLVAFTSVEAGALAKFLRLSEDPSHTEWREKGARLGEHYEKPGLLMRCVKGGIKAIHDRLTLVEVGVDTDLLADVFFLEEDDPDSVVKVGPGGRGQRPQKARVPKTLKMPETPVRIAARECGIVLTGVPGVVKEGQVIRVHLAYEVRRGNAFTKWSPFDFDLANMKGSMEWSGAMRLRAEGCVLEFAVEHPDFEVLINGFDPGRDIRIKADVLANLE